MKDWKITKGNLESGNVRFDVNINIPHHPIVEVKNLNSFQNIRDAIEYEIMYQSLSLKEMNHSSLNSSNLLQSQSPLSPSPSSKDCSINKGKETKRWDERTRRTISMRKKEKEYFWIREWDIPEQIITEERIQRIQKEMSLTRPPTDDELEELSLETSLDLKKIKELKNANLLSLFKELFKKINNPTLVYNW